MANITGTQGNDTLTGTVDDDIIKGLGGNDRIVASDGSDSIDGGAGYDTLDYSNLILTNNSGNIVLDLSQDAAPFINKGFSSGKDSINSIEKIIANPNKQNSVEVGFSSIILDQTSKNTKLDVDLSKNSLKYSSLSNGTKTISIENFQDIRAGNADDRLKGNDQNNLITGGDGDNIFIGSKGSDILVDTTDRFRQGSQIFQNTVDYSNIGAPITLSTGISIGQNRIVSTDLSAKKGDFGGDTIRGVIKIIGATNQENTIDGSANFNQQGFNASLRLNIDLANNSLKTDVNLGQSVTDFKVINFVNAVGTGNDDTIVGANKKGKLTGGGGNDTITGGNKNDIITGSDSTARGIGEVDTLTGGGGRDKFVLGDATGAYYVGKGKDDFATITDFNLFQDSISIGNLKNYSFASGGNNTIELYSGKDVNTRDLIAKIQLTGGISTRSTNSRSVMGADANLNAITSKLDILVGSNSTADA
jgi:Ca2+-binding RTX toxin-like protein